MQANCQQARQNRDAQRRPSHTSIRASLDSSSKNPEIVKFTAALPSRCTKTFARVRTDSPRMAHIPTAAKSAPPIHLSSPAPAPLALASKAPGTNKKNRYLLQSQKRTCSPSASPSARKQNPRPHSHPAGPRPSRGKSFEHATAAAKSRYPRKPHRERRNEAYNDRPPYEYHNTTVRTKSSPRTTTSQTPSIGSADGRVVGRRILYVTCPQHFSRCKRLSTIPAVSAAWRPTQEKAGRAVFAVCLVGQTSPVMKSLAYIGGWRPLAASSCSKHCYDSGLSPEARRSHFPHMVA